VYACFFVPRKTSVGDMKELPYPSSCSGAKHPTGKTAEQGNQAMPAGTTTRTLPQGKANKGTNIPLCWERGGQENLELDSIP
jgi:hypothetical protein